MAKAGQTHTAQADGLVQVHPVNEAVLQGRVSAEPEQRELPSGDLLCTFRLVVPRGEAARGRQTVDTIDCAAWTARVRRSAMGWRAGDLVEVRSAVRRRFFRVGTGSASRVEIEVAAGRVIRRADSAS